MFVKIPEVTGLKLYLNKSDPPQLVVHGEGDVPTTGWTETGLIPWAYVAEPSDGIQDFDFVALAPSGIVMNVITRITADIRLTPPNWVKGVRIHAGSNNIEGLIGQADVSFDGIEFAGGEIPWPLQV